MDNALYQYCERCIITNPRAVLIERWTPPEHTGGGLIVPRIVRDKEALGGFWAKLLKVSEAPTTDEQTIIFRDFLKKLVGHYVLFNPQNPVVAGMTMKEGHQYLQIMATGEVLLSFEPLDFFKVVVASYVGEEEAKVLYEEEMLCRKELSF